MPLRIRSNEPPDSPRGTRHVQTTVIPAWKRGAPEGCEWSSPTHFGIASGIGIQAISNGLLNGLMAASIPFSGSGRDEAMLRGLVVPYNQPSQSAVPVIFRPGCFDTTFKRDLRLTINFSGELILGRETAHTLHLIEEDDALYFENFTPNTSWATDLLVSIDRGDIRGSSTAYVPLEQHIENRGGRKVRIIEKAFLAGLAIASFADHDDCVQIVQPQETEDENDEALLRSMGIAGGRE